MFIEGGGSSKLAGVTEENQLLVQAETQQIQHYISKNNKQAYQIIGNVASVSSGTNTILHFKNTSPSLLAVFTYIRLQVISLSGGTALPDVATYLQIGSDTLYDSGGVSVNPVNVNLTSANLADIMAYSNPITTGSLTEIDRLYPINGDQKVFNKEGSLILGQNDAIEVRLVTDHTSGLAYTRMSFLMIEPPKI